MTDKMTQKSHEDMSKEITKMVWRCVHGDIIYGELYSV